MRDAQDADQTLLVTDATFLEVGFVLRAQGTGYGWAVEDIAKVLTDLLEAVPFTFERAGVLRASVEIHGAEGFDAARLLPAGQSARGRRAGHVA